MADADLPIHPDEPRLEALAREGRVIAYFGYGSLVNKRTLRTKFLGIRRAEVFGWRRAWLPRKGQSMALLSVRPDAAATTQGVIVYDLADHLPSVDEREAAYHRRVVMPGHITIRGQALRDVPLFIYEGKPEEPDAAQMGAAILQSYLDAVLQGFLSLYGEAGLRRFVTETEGFETSILKDRGAPLYPRPVTLSEGEADLFDRLVLERGAHFIDVS